MCIRFVLLGVSELFFFHMKQQGNTVYHISVLDIHLLFSPYILSLQQEQNFGKN